MQTMMTKKDATIEDVSDDLAYHLELVKAMTGCTIGRYNITSVEAKVQSMWKYSDVVSVSVITITITTSTINSNTYITTTITNTTG